MAALCVCAAHGALFCRLSHGELLFGLAEQNKRKIRTISVPSPSYVLVTPRNISLSMLLRS